MICEHTGLKHTRAGFLQAAQRIKHRIITEKRGPLRPPMLVSKVWEYGVVTGKILNRSVARAKAALEGWLVGVSGYNGIGWQKLARAAPPHSQCVYFGSLTSHLHSYSEVLLSTEHRCFPFPVWRLIKRHITYPLKIEETPQKKLTDWISLLVVFEGEG